MALAARWKEAASLTYPGSFSRAKPTAESTSCPYVLRSETMATGRLLTVVRTCTMPCRVRSTWKRRSFDAPVADGLGRAVSSCTFCCIGTHRLPTLYAVERTVGVEPSVLHSRSAT